LALAVYTPAAVVSGRIELRDSREKAVQRGQDYSGVVVSLQPVGGAQIPAGTGARATMLQKDKRFQPHVLAIRAGTVVDFPNLDPIFHNAFSNYSGQIFDVGLYKPGSTRAVTFTRPGIVRVFCNIHPHMSAVIAVLPAPWFSVSSRDGSFRIPNVPPGEYRLEVFHERAAPEQLEALRRTLKVGTEEVQTGPIAISESGFLPAPHLNKHGKPYSPQSENYKVVK
jgi:plastocyanin